MPRIRLLEAGPNDGVEFDVPRLPPVWEMPIPNAIIEVPSTAEELVSMRPATWSYVPIGWQPGFQDSPNAKQLMTPRQIDEGQGYYRDVTEPAVMYVRKDQLSKLARRVS